MYAEDVNAVTITGNLTRDPELRHTKSGTAVCDLRVAVNGRRKAQNDEWVNKPNYFDVTVWGAYGAAIAGNLSKGRGVAVEGRLDWQEWEAKDGSGKRQAVKIIGETVRYMGSKPEDEMQGAEATAEAEGQRELATNSDPGAESSNKSSQAAEEDIPF